MLKTPFYKKEFLIKKCLGKGENGSTHRAIHLPSKQRVILKKILKPDHSEQGQSTMREIRKEIAILTLLNHPHLPRFYGYFETKTEFWLVMNDIRAKDLFDLVCYGNKFTTARILSIFAQILQGVSYLHRLGVIHRDLKLENVVLDKHDHVLLIDVGMAGVEKEPGATMDTPCGSHQYASPEVLSEEGKYRGPPVDVWSLGVILYVMVCQAYPFVHESVPTLIQLIKRGRYVIPEEVDPNVADLIRSMLRVDVRKRATLQQIANHRCFQMTLGHSVQLSDEKEQLCGESKEEVETKEVDVAHVVADLFRMSPQEARKHAAFPKWTQKVRMSKSASTSFTHES